MKIGIFAGTFDPIHNGHLEFAKQAIAQAGLEKIVIVAEKEPYRKKPHVSWDHRQAMIERATQDIAQVDHDYQFASQLTQQHTLKSLLQSAKQHYGVDNETWFLVGSDIYEHMHQWKDLAQAHEYGGFVVALRDDHTEDWLKAQQAKAQQFGITGKVIVVANHQPHVSSSLARSQVAAQQSTSLLPNSVASYISTHQLYSS